MINAAFASLDKSRLSFTAPFLVLKGAARAALTTSANILAEMTSDSASPNPPIFARFDGPGIGERKALGLAVLEFLAGRAMSRDELALKAKLKRATLDDVISGKTVARAVTRGKLASGLGITPQELRDAEMAHARPAPLLNPTMEALLRDVLAQVEGLPLAIARSIVAEFGEDGADKGSGELEALLRRKAVEYRSLRADLVRYSPSDPEVRALRDSALYAVDRGDFDVAYQQLSEARGIDQRSAREAEVVVHARRSSEAETILSAARLAALRAKYQDAFKLCLEARQVVAGSSLETEGRSITMAAGYLNAECQEFGTEGVIETNIRLAEDTVLHFAASHPSSTYHAVCFEIADLYALLGYRLGSNRILHIAARKYREICENLSSDAPDILKIRTFNSLGDTHAEIGLNRRSKRQLRVGLKIMKSVLGDATIHVPAAERANCLIRLGTAQANAGLVPPVGQEYAESAASYESAMELIRGLKEPLTEARAWWGLSIALAGQGKEARSVDVLLRAEACCEQALRTLTRDKYPIDWATIIQNRGNAKLERGRLENDTQALLTAVDDYLLALEVRTKARFPLGFVKTKGNMAIAKRLIAERLNDYGFAMSAKLDIEEALDTIDAESRAFWNTFYSEEAERVDSVVADLRNRNN